MLGTLATVIAVLAVAAVGAMMLTGRINIRHGATVIFGCFILFGASSIVVGIMGIANGAGVTSVLPPPPIEVAAPIVVPPLDPVPYDPYAGASVERR